MPSIGAGRMVPAGARLGAPPWRRLSLWDVVFWLVMAAAVAVVSSTFPDFGITFDEPLHVEYGQRALEWYASLGKDRAVLEFQNLYLYGALFDTVEALFENLLPLDVYATRRLIGGLTGLLGVLAVRRIARDIAGEETGARAGLIAGLCLLLIPDWWGHSFANPKDVPFAVAAAWTLSWLVRVGRSLDAEAKGPSLGSVAMLGLCFGMALGIRVGGVLLAGPIMLTLLAHLAKGVLAGDTARQTGATALRLVRRMWIAVPIAYVIMVAAWPWAQVNPLRHPMEALAEFSKFPMDFTFTFAGVQVRTTNLPWWYLPVGFGVKLPEVELLGLVAIAAFGVVAALRRPFPAGVRLDGVALTTAVLLPPAAVVATDAVLYDGIRHMLFLMPPLATAAGLGLNGLVTRLPLRWPRNFWLNPFMAALLVACAAVQVGFMAHLHPYETIWFNRFVGGVRGAGPKFELDYWGSSLSEAAKRLTDTMVKLEGPQALTQPYRIRVCGPPTSVFHYLPPAWKPTRRNTGPVDFYLAFTRWACKEIPAGQDIVRIERDGEVLAYVRDLREPPQ
ncbi:hypothetical protein [Nitrospirillum viridazoti]|uniref:Dolichyl-phosphate-mannose-protein mannosyltransferase n=1 Tax=Nitrospirillum amazonense TaxID=28077 RepID=A0A560I7K6_9PROT|nr:hypothetical protein [Nitrospirillum amazonense]TWB54395.1 hypothetical protein FBZ92_115163 [Nitrospirillum amazonense]